MTGKYQPWPSEADPAWRRLAKQAMKEADDMLTRIPPRQRDIGDPNHPVHTGLFGQDVASFLKRQQ